MDRSEFKVYIQENYGIEPDCPWIEYHDYEVFRHDGNKKWFALVMGVPKNKFGLPGCEILDVVNLKCNPLLLGSLLGEKGFFPHII